MFFLTFAKHIALRTVFFARIHGNQTWSMRQPYSVLYSPVLKQKMQFVQYF